MEMQKVSSEDMVGERRREREAKELMFVLVSVNVEEGRSRDLLSKRETRRATAIVVVIESGVWIGTRGVVVRDKEWWYCVTMSDGWCVSVDQSRTRNGYETSLVATVRGMREDGETSVVLFWWRWISPPMEGSKATTRYQIMNECGVFVFCPCISERGGRKKRKNVRVEWMKKRGRFAVSKEVLVLGVDENSPTRAFPPLGET
jgi:hypothetical protein